jgi:hypothetical protein
MVRYRSRRLSDVGCVLICETSPINDAGSAISGCSFCCNRGESSGINHIYRLYREEGLIVRKCKARRRADWIRATILVEAGSTHGRPSISFMTGSSTAVASASSTLWTTLRASAWRAVPDTSISGNRVARELTTIVNVRGRPQMIASDYGTEFTFNAVLTWGVGS